MSSKKKQTQPSSRRVRALAAFLDMGCISDDGKPLVLKRLDELFRGFEE